MRWLKQFFSRTRHYDELSETIREHLEEKIADLMDGGMTRIEAERTARREFGNVTRIEERSREVWQWPTLESALADIRFTLRMISRSLGFATVAIVTLALGIGANTAIFSVIDAVMMRPLPVRDPEQLVLLRWMTHRDVNVNGSSYGDCKNSDAGDCVFSFPFSKAVRGQSNSFSGLAVFAGPLDINFTGNGPAVISRGEYVSGDFFSTLGLKMILGRPLEPVDDQPSAPPLSFSLTPTGSARSVAIGRRWAAPCASITWTPSSLASRSQAFLTLRRARLKTSS